LPKNHLRILRNEGESLIQISDAIRDWALLRYHVCETSEHRKGARAREKMESPKPSHRATREAAENLKGTNETANAISSQRQDRFALIPIALESTRQETNSRIRCRK
jgi:hypothetical protein